MDQSENSLIFVKQEPLGNDDATSEQQPRNNQPTMTSSGRPLDQFCRLCLRQRPDLVPRFSRVQDMTFSDVFFAITGLEMTLDNTYPLKMCRTCMELLDYAFDIRRNFIESYQILRNFVVSKTQPLITSLSDYQGGVRATRETLAERMLREYRDLRSQRETVDQHKAVPKVDPYVGIPPRYEEPVEPPVQIKHEPELILEPEELSYSAVAVEESITKYDEPSVEEVDKMHNVAPGNELDPYKCYICSKVFETPKAVQAHLSEHVHMIPYQCSECTNEGGQKLKIISLNRLQSHFRMHVSPIKCPECPHRTCTRWAMQAHIGIYHEQTDQLEYICKQCGKKYLNRRALYKHMIVHKALDEGRFTCSYCDKKLPSKATLIQHKRIHTGKKPYQCNVCEKSFRLSWYLSGHISKMHTKPGLANDSLILTCKFEGCNFSTSNKYSYYNHKAQHDLRFQCPQCSQSFPKKEEFQEHVADHSNDLPFACSSRANS